MRENELSRRAFLRLSAAMSAGAIAAACAPATPEVVEVVKEVPVEKVVKETVVVEKEVVVEKPVKPAEKLTLRYWFGWGAGYGQAVEDSTKTEEFQEYLPGVQVELLPGTADEKLLTAIAAGDPPDGASNLHYFELFARGACMPVTEWVNTSDVFVEEDYLRDAFKMGTWQGEIYGPPCNECFVRIGLIYNVELVEESGLDPNNPPQTWDECFEWHEKCTKFDSAGNAEIIGFDPYASAGGYFGHDPWVQSKSWGFDYFDEENMEFHLDVPGVAESLAVCGKFYEHVGPDNMAAFRESYGTWAAPNASMFVGTQAMEINGYWQCGRRFHRAPDRVFGYSWIPVPEERKGIRVQSTGGHVMVIPKGSKHPYEMFRFAEFLNGDVGCDAIFGAVGWLPGRLSYIEKVDPSVYPGLEWWFRSIEEADEMASTEVNPVCGFAHKTWVDVREKVYRGAVTAEAGAKEMQEKCTEALRELMGQA